MEYHTFILWMLLFNIVLMIPGGLIAIKKKDYFSRGAAICGLTGIFGFFVLVFSPESNARQDERDLHFWPESAGLAGVAMVAMFVLPLILLIPFLICLYLINRSKATNKPNLDSEA